MRGEQTALVNEMIEGQKVVQAFGHEAESLAAFDEVNGRLQSVSLKAIFFSSMTNPATRFVNNIVYAGVGLVGAVYAVAGGITIGQLSIFLNYANQYTKPFNEISGVVTELQNALACAARVFELLDAEDQVPEAENAKVLETDGHVELEGRFLPLPAGPPPHRGPGSGCEARPAHRHRRPHRLRQDHPYQFAHAVLRCQRRLH